MMGPAAELLKEIELQRAKEEAERAARNAEWARQQAEEAARNNTSTATTNKGSVYTEETLAGGGVEIYNSKFSNTLISGTSGRDHITTNSMAKVTIVSGADDDTVSAGGVTDYLYGTAPLVEERVVAYSGDGNDSISCIGNVLVDGGAGSDTINNGNSYTTIYGGAGADSIYSFNSTINAGAGNDTVNLSYGGKNNVIQYAEGDGNDLIQNLGSSDTLGIYGGYSTQTSGNDVLVYVGSGTITLEDASGKTVNIEKSSYAFPTSGAEKFATPTTSTPITSTPTTYTPTNYVYTGGNRSIYDYAGEQIILSMLPTGLNFIGNDFYFYAGEDELAIMDVKEKVIDFRDGYGGEFAKAYATDNAGNIDARNVAGFQYIVGAENGSNIILAGNDGSNLWGNTGNATDILYGGAGYDTFFAGKGDGDDAVQNASAADNVNLYNVTLSDIVLADESNGVIGLAFNTGNVITIQSTDYISAKINLADGKSYRFNHATKSWLSA